MSAFGVKAGEFPVDNEAMDKQYDATTVFKNFSNGKAARHHSVKSKRTSTGSREVVVEVKKVRKVAKP